jgi:hypothetical protein
VATFSSVSKSYGQACTENALHPIAGKSYDYSITATGGGTAKTYQWIVTTSTNIVSSGTLAAALDPGLTTYAITDADKATAKIVWAPELIADALKTTGGKDYYVVVKYVATSTAGCDVDNIKVFKIEPVNMFQLDLKNVLSDGTDMTGTDICTSNIVGATITEGTTPKIAYNYGVTNLYIKVSAKNFKGDWTLLLDRDNIVSKAAGAGESAKLYWGSTASTTTTEIPAAATSVSIAEAAGHTDPTSAMDIYLKLEVTHNTFEGLTPETFDFTINATDKGGNPDVASTDCSTSLTDDKVSQTILARPTVANNGTTGGDFIQP